MKKDNYRAYIVDDEQEGIDVLSYDIRRLELPLSIDQVFTDPKEALKVIRQNPPDILFLDIEMPWMNGFELLDSLGEIQFQVIFITAYDQYAIKAFKYFAVDYLLKPTDKDQLRLSIERAIQTKNVITKDRIEALLSTTKSKGEIISKLALPTLSGYEFVEIDHIVRCQADNNYAIVHFLNNKKVVISKTLKHLQSLLTDQPFYRCHHSHLINLNHISRYVKSDGGYLEMVDTSIIPISRNRKEGLLKHFKG